MVKTLTPIILHHVCYHVCNLQKSVFRQLNCKEPSFFRESHSAYKLWGFGSPSEKWSEMFLRFECFNPRCELSLFLLRWLPDNCFHLPHFVQIFSGVNVKKIINRNDGKQRPSTPAGDRKKKHFMKTEPIAVLRLRCTTWRCRSQHVEETTTFKHNCYFYWMHCFIYICNVM